MLRLAFLSLWLIGGAATAAESPADNHFRDRIAPFLKAHCVKCHGPDKQSGDVRLDDLTADPKFQARWLAVRDQIRDGLMPPAKEPKPDVDASRAVVAWATVATGAHPSKLPNQGNLIPHELLFGKPAETAEPPPARVWRISPDGYMGFVREMSRGRVPGIIQPFTLTPERGLKDFAGLYTVDEPSTEILVRNAEAIVLSQTANEIKDGKLSAKHDTVAEFVKLMDPAKPPTPAQLESAVRSQYRMAVGREPDAEELKRYVALYEKCTKGADSPTAVRTVLQAVLLKTDAVYRSERGSGSGKTILAPDELVRAVSLALGDRRDPTVVQAAQKGELKTREQVAAQVRRLLDDPKAENPRLLRFFREYFEYHKAADVFKDKPSDGIKHLPGQLVKDTDRLVLHILAADKAVFRELLTTPVSFVNYSTKMNKQTRKEEAVPGDVLPKPDPNPKRKPDWLGTVHDVYGFKEWPSEQPVPLPKDTRLGILMQPSWLVAWSTNFENDPVRRGRWIRERLLGGTVPDLPIGVLAQVPDASHRTYRDRLSVTRDAACWKCHNRMDELGLSFEQFDHFGRFRTAEPVRDDETTAKNVDKKGKSLGVVMKDAPLATTGTIADSGDQKLDGPVKDPRELVRKIADSARARQVFVRHAFRYFLGRNETLADAKALQDADRAYQENDGSFKALVVSLLTSDAFLCRTAPTLTLPEKGEPK